MEQSDLPFLSNPSYKWIFVGGKGGVGKTSSSCAIAAALTKSRKSVLLVSTDPASNLSDAFQQHFSTEPTLVNGFTNLYAMNTPDQLETSGIPEGFETLSHFPGTDEIQALGNIFRTIEKNAYDVVVFDTAPTGHTMKLLGLPGAMKDLFTGSIMSMLSSTMSMMGGPQGQDTTMLNRFQELIANASKTLTNPELCTFVCVTLPEFSPIYETERLIDFLTDSNIETHTIIVNQVLDKENSKSCPFCSKKYEMQQKFLKDIYEVYGEFFRIVEVPAQVEEIQGRASILNFANKIAPIITQ